jgi:hypothetical protein
LYFMCNHTIYFRERSYFTSLGSLGSLFPRLESRCLHVMAGHAGVEGIGFLNTGGFPHMAWWKPLTVTEDGCAVVVDVWLGCGQLGCL